MWSKYFYAILILYLYGEKGYCNQCIDHKTCSECLRDPIVCVWCAHMSSTPFNGPRCRSENSVNSWCPDQLQSTNNSLKLLDENNKDFMSGEDGIQIKPQLYELKLRPGKPQNFTFSYLGARDYPVDLYFLLDASNTMNATKTSIVTYSQSIYETMQNMTNNTKLGFGTFIDKNAFPFAVNINQERAYSFKHRLKLTSSYEQFRDIVNGTEFGGNRDFPEGGFDALAQVMACNRLIGWRTKARKIVILLTDETMHVAGDGRSAGIFEPYDGQCHTFEDKGRYTKELTLDYPSIGMINKLASDNEISVFFVLTDIKYEVEYELLRKAIRGSKLAILTNADQIVSNLKSFYEEISTNVKLVVSKNNHYKIDFNPNCAKDGLEDCKVDIGKKKDFTGTITLQQYYGTPADTINITLQGTNEKLILKVEVLSSCPCETQSKFDSKCNGEKLDCGVCVCGNVKYGRNCECHKNEMKTEKDSLLHCLAPRDSGSENYCSENGDCDCGTCKCSHNFFGEFCENSKQDCFYNQKDCNGKGHCYTAIDGEGKGEVACRCDDRWNGTKCECDKSTESCKHVVDNKVYECNNRGHCACNSCKCPYLDTWDKRTDQDSLCRPLPCPGCHSMQCDVVRACALCHLDSGNCDNKCEGIILKQKHDKIPSEYLNSRHWRVCDHEKINVGCYTRFVYKYDDKNYKLLIRIQENNDCAEVYYVYGGIVLGTLLLGGILALLAWKCITNYQDRKEYETFEKNHQDILTGPCDNPLYVEAKTTFRNPAFISSIK